MHRKDYRKRADTSSVEAEALKQALRQFASGVTIVTAEGGGERFGITASSFTSISLDPPIVMVAINNASTLAEAIVTAEHFAVHILSRDQQNLSARFASSIPSSDKYEGLRTSSGRSGAPTFGEPLATLDCVLDQTLVIGSHTLMFGRVVHAVSLSDPDSPLVYYHRAYRELK